MEAIVSIGMGIFFPLAKPAVSALVNGLVGIGATVGATYGSDVLNNTTAQMPTLVVPPDKNNEADLITAASLYQQQLVNGLNDHGNLSNTGQFFYPIFSDVGLLRALANLNPLVLDNNNDGHDKLVQANPTAAAVTSAAWKALLPSYYKWEPIDPTKESQSQNFDNFYPGATPASAGDATNQLAAMQLATGGKPYQYPGFYDAGQITYDRPTAPNGDNAPANPNPPTTMASFPADSTSGGETQHPERFFTLLGANLTEQGQFLWQENTSWDYNSSWINFGLQFGYARDGLYVSGWKLVDNNMEEIDPATAQLVFPSANNPPQAVTDGPEFVPFGGGWYLDVAPPPPSSQTNATSATWMDVYANWFHQSSLVPSSPVSGALNNGTYQARDGWHGTVMVGNPLCSVSFQPLGPVPPTFPFDHIAYRGFEQVSVGAGGYQYNPTGTAWTFTPQSSTAADGSGIAANGSGFTLFNPPAPEGTHVAFLQGISSISQSVTFGAAGSYQLDFSAAQGAKNPSQQDFQVLIDGAPVGTITPGSTSYWNEATAPFKISNPGSHTITFQGLDSAGGDNTALIDRVVVTRVSVQAPVAARGSEQVSAGPAGPGSTRPALPGHSHAGPLPAGLGSRPTRAAASRAIHRPFKAFRALSDSRPVHSANLSSAGAPVRGLRGVSRYRLGGAAD